MFRAVARADTRAMAVERTSHRHPLSRLPEVKHPEVEHPETAMLGYGYRPEWSEGALKPPIFQSSTFVFRNAAEGKHFFEVAYGMADRAPGEAIGLIYSRLNNPDV